MKDKGLVLVLILVAAGLGVALIVVNNKASDERKTAVERAATASNQIVTITKSRDDLQVVNKTLESNLVSVRTEYSNKLALSEANLQSAKANLEKVTVEAEAKAKVQAENDAQALAERDKRIAGLESQNQTLDKEAADLRTAITNLQTQIVATQAKLGKSVKDRELLLSELKTLQAKRDELERRFNDIAALRDQLRKLNLDVVIKRRLDWVRRGVYANPLEKGGERLITLSSQPSQAASAGTSVELHPRGAPTIHQSPPTNVPAK